MLPASLFRQVACLFVLFIHTNTYSLHNDGPSPENSQAESTCAVTVCSSEGDEKPEARRKVRHTFMRGLGDYSRKPTLIRRRLCLRRVSKRSTAYWQKVPIRAVLFEVVFSLLHTLTSCFALTELRPEHFLDEG